MQNYDDKLDGFSQEENELLLQAYNEKFEQNLAEQTSDIFDQEDKRTIQAFDEQNFRYIPTTSPQPSHIKNDENYYVAPQVEYAGLSSNEQTHLDDLISDLKQYFNDDFGLSAFCTNQNAGELERPFFYFVSKTKILSKIVALVCSIFDKAKRNGEVNELLSLLIKLADKINTKA